MLNLDQITEQGVRLDFTRPNPKRLKRKRRKEHKEVKTE